MGTQRPNDDEIEVILNAAMRTQDHGKMFPWYFIVIKDEARKEIGQIVAKAYQTDEDTNASPAKLELESERFLRAPMPLSSFQEFVKASTLYGSNIYPAARFAHIYHWLATALVTA